jgi:hypothetical protein
MYHDCQVFVFIFLSKLRKTLLRQHWKTAAKLAEKLNSKCWKIGGSPMLINSKLAQNWRTADFLQLFPID